MKRLTKRYASHIAVVCDNCKEKGSYCDTSVCRDVMLNRLAEYEDMEERGLLVRLPCKVGDTVYVTEPRYYNGAVHTGIQNGKVYGFEFDEEGVVWGHWADDNPHSGNAYPIADIGKTVFFTREAAERALEDANGL